MGKLFDMRCDKCKFFEPNPDNDETLFCQNKKLMWYGSGGEYGFCPERDFYCKYFRVTKDDKTTSL
jgi:hypothetical protein